MTTEEIWIGENDVRRQLEGEELEAFLAMRAEIKKAKDDAEAEAAQRAIAKAALLERLGITADEAALLLG
jgi:hypothetical protein